AAGRVVEPPDDIFAGDVVEHLPAATLPALDFARGERFLQHCPHRLDIAHRRRSWPLNCRDASSRRSSCSAFFITYSTSARSMVASPPRSNRTDPAWPFSVVNVTIISGR